jgi:hypothetical protein
MFCTSTHFLTLRSEQKVWMPLKQASVSIPWSMHAHTAMAGFDGSRGPAEPRTGYATAAAAVAGGLASAGVAAAAGDGFVAGFAAAAAGAGAFAAARFVGAASAGATVCAAAVAARNSSRVATAGIVFVVFMFLAVAWMLLDSPASADESGGAARRRIGGGTQQRACCAAEGHQTVAGLRCDAVG